MSIVRVQDCQELGYCMKSVRPWFARHGIDFQKFVRDGVDESVLLATDDEFARNAVANAKKREANDGQ